MEFVKLTNSRNAQVGCLSQAGALFKQEAVPHLGVPVGEQSENEDCSQTQDSKNKCFQRCSLVALDAAKAS